MKRRSFIIIVTLLSLNLMVMTLLFAGGTWIVQVDDNKISLKEFTDAYKAVVYFRILSSPAPVEKEQIRKVLESKDGKRLYLKSFVDEYLIVEKAKEKELFDESKINRQIKGISKNLKRQLIIKKFIEKYIYPKVKVSSSAVNKAYKEEIKRKNSRLKGMPVRQAKKLIKQQLRAQKAMKKLKRYVEKLRLEAEILYNKSISIVSDN
ncbi:MAG TPA: hypothetical protein ENI73_02705 [Spirochaetes bacterium]|nr:hypothetical protein [Spirochaetota bacterium]